MNQPIDLSIVVAAHNAPELVERCLQHVEASEDHLSKEVIYVDDGSTDKSAEKIREQFPSVKVIASPENLGFVRANNLGYQEARGKYLLMLNSDAYLAPKTLQTIVDFMEKTANAGVVGCRAINGKGELLPSARFFPTPWRLFLMKMGLADRINQMHLNHDEVRECDWVTGCCLFVKKEIVDPYGYLLRPEIRMYNDDNDLCFRVKKRGWKVYFHPETIVHLHGANSKKIAKERRDTTLEERYTIESDYVYFRHNHGLHAVAGHFMMMVLYDLIQMAKGVLLRNKNIQIRMHAQHIQTAFKLLISTKFGTCSSAHSNRA